MVFSHVASLCAVYADHKRLVDSADLVHICISYSLQLAMSNFYGPTFFVDKKNVTRHDFIMLLDHLEEIMPGYRFQPDAPCDGGGIEACIHVLHFPGQKWRREDINVLLCTLQRLLGRSCPEIVNIVAKFVGAGHHHRGSSYKVMRMFGEMDWRRLTRRARFDWVDDTTPLFIQDPFFGGAIANDFGTCFKAFGMPRWTADELNAIFGALHQLWGASHSDADSSDDDYEDYDGDKDRRKCAGTTVTKKLRRDMAASVFGVQLRASYKHWHRAAVGTRPPES